MAVGWGEKNIQHVPANFFPYCPASWPTQNKKKFFQGVLLRNRALIIL